jgi:arabinofuranan 3-O-arabinosyltransferase
VLGTDEVPVTVEASFSWIPLGLVLSRSDGPLGEVDQTDAVDDTGAVVPAGTISPRPGARVVDVDGDAPATLVLAVPAGKGWTALADGQELPSLSVAGWAQGWTLPEGASRVTVRYASGEVLRWTAGPALSGWALVLALALWSSAGSRRTRVPGR